MNRHSMAALHSSVASVLFAGIAGWAVNGGAAEAEVEGLSSVGLVDATEATPEPAPQPMPTQADSENDAPASAGRSAPSEEDEVDP